MQGEVDRVAASIDNEEPAIIQDILQDIDSFLGFGVEGTQLLVGFAIDFEAAWGPDDDSGVGVEEVVLLAHKFYTFGIRCIAIVTYINLVFTVVFQLEVNALGKQLPAREHRQLPREGQLPEQKQIRKGMRR